MELLTMAKKVENDGHEQDSEAALRQRWLSDIVRYLGEHGGSQGVMMTSLGEKVLRPVGLKVKLGKILVSEEAVRAGVSITGTSPSTAASYMAKTYSSRAVVSLSLSDQSARPPERATMATHGDAGWIAASLERLLPPNLKERPGFAQKVEAAIQVSERKKYLANFEVVIRHLLIRCCYTTSLCRVQRLF
jgi:hypothetical protein